MKKKWILLLLLTLQCVARGQTAAQVTAFDCRLLVDGEVIQEKSLAANGGTVSWDADVAALPVGLHQVSAQVVSRETPGSRTMQFNSFFYRVASGDQPAHQVEGACYIDETLVKQSALDVNGGMASWNLDASALPVGLHRVKVCVMDRCGETCRTDSYSSFFYRVAAEAASLSHEVDARCYIDGTLFKEERLEMNGALCQWSLDMSALPRGLHTAKVIVTDKTVQGVVTSCYNTLFFHETVSQEVNHNLFGYCYVDGELIRKEALTIDAGLVQWNLDMSSLPVGLHTVNVVVVDENDEATAWRYNSLFYRVPAGSDVKGIKGYDYWVNQEHQGHSDVTPYQEVYLLDTLLAVTEQEIRSTSFHFAVEDDIPVVYAQNDLWVMFHDISGKEANAMCSYTDIRTRREVTDAILLLPGETASMARPADNEIKWYKVEAMAGDSLMFKTDKACTWQLFSPTGKELYRADGTQATDWAGTFTIENGIHYIAVHDMTVTGNTLSISYNHIDGQYALDECDWQILQSFYAQYGNGNFVWDLTDRVNVRELDGVSIAIGRVVAMELPGKGLQGTFPTMLLGLGQLRSLDLSDNGLSGDAADAVAQYAAEHDSVAVNLQELNIARNDFEGNVGDLASYLSALTSLNASGNRFDEVSPAVNTAVSLDISGQRLTFDGDITRGWNDVLASIPTICYYDHRTGKQSTTLSAVITDAAQDPEWTLSLAVSGSGYSMNTSGDYRGVNGQAVTATTSLSNGSWINRQQLGGVFTFAMGDANLSGNVDVTDLQAIINRIYGEYSRAFNFTAANHKADVGLNVLDVVGQVNVLLAMTPEQPSSAALRVPAREAASSLATLYWSDGVLYLSSTVPVAAVDVVNAVDGDIRWNVDRLGMIVSAVKDGSNEHTVIYSLGDAVIPAGVTALASTSKFVHGIVGAKLSDADAHEVPVSFINALTGVNEVEDSKATVSVGNGGLLISGDALEDVDVTVCSVDGRVVFNTHLDRIDGTAAVSLPDTGADGYRIVVVRVAGQVIATHKLTQIR